MRIAYADPPYPGQSAKHYANHPDFAGEVNHFDLAAQLRAFDGFVLHTASTTLPYVLDCLYNAELHDYYAADFGSSEFRILAWVKPFAAFKRNVPVAYAWEPVIVKAARKPTVRKDMGFTYRDWLDESITLKRGLTGAKPERVCHWLFECVGAEPDDELVDLFPGTGAVTRAWETWRSLRSIAACA